MTEKAELGSAARKRKKAAAPPLPTTSKTGLNVVTPPSIAPSGPEKDHEGSGGVSADHEFDLDYTDQRGYHWTGHFKSHILNIKERAAVGLTRSRLTANTPAQVVDAATLNLLEMQAHLAVALDDAPEWAADLGELYDVGVVAAIYREVASHEARFWGTDNGEAR